MTYIPLVLRVRHPASGLHQLVARLWRPLAWSSVGQWAVSTHSSSAVNRALNGTSRICCDAAHEGDRVQAGQTRGAAEGGGHQRRPAPAGHRHPGGPD